MKDGRLELTYRGERVVANTTCLPWEIRDPAHDTLLEWSVLLAAPALQIDTLAVFVSRDDVRAWVADMDGSVPEELLTTLNESFDEDCVENAGKLKRENGNAAYRKLSVDKKLPLASAKLFDLAIKRGILNSLVLLSEKENDTQDVEVVEVYTPELPKGFVARWAHSEGKSTLYDWSYAKERPKPKGKTQVLYGECRELPIAFITRAAETGQ